MAGDAPGGVFEIVDELREGLRVDLADRAAQAEASFDFVGLVEDGNSEAAGAEAIFFVIERVALLANSF